MILKKYETLFDNKQPIVVFDLETTGLSPIKERIIEIGAFRLEDGIVVKKLSTLVNPNNKEH